MGKNVMIVPEARAAVRVGRSLAGTVDLNLHQQNWIWANQWRQLMPAERELVSVPIDGDVGKDFVAAITKAARLASGKYVILFTGHGTRAPRGQGRRRIGRFQFDTVPEPEDRELDQHRKTIDRQVLDFLDIAQKDGGRWVPKPQPKRAIHADGRVGAVTPVIMQGTVDALLPRWQAIEAMRDQFRKHGVAKLIVLTCNLGLFGDECRKFAKLIERSVVFCKELVAGTEIDFDADDNPASPFVDRSVVLWLTSDRSWRQPSDPNRNSWSGTWRRHPYWTQLPAGIVQQFEP